MIILKEKNPRPRVESYLIAEKLYRLLNEINKSQKLLN